MITTKIKKEKAQKCVIKWKLKIEDYTHYIAAQHENKIHQLENNKVDVNSLRGNYKKSIKKNKLILRSQ